MNVGENTEKILFLSTRGFNAIGVDELVFVLEDREVLKKDIEKENLNDLLQNSNCQNETDIKKKEKIIENSIVEKQELTENLDNKEMEDSNLRVEEDVNIKEKKVELIEDQTKPLETEDEKFVEDLVEILNAIYKIYFNCLNPIENTLDDRMGIRRCVNRMSKMHPILTGQLAGIPAAALILHRPQGQVILFIFFLLI